MKTIKILLLIISVCITQGGIAQYKIDWKNAPANPFPAGRYTKEQFNLKGDIKSEKVPGDFGYEYVFDQKGRVILNRSSLFGDMNYEYDNDGRLARIVSKTEYGNTTEVFLYDNKGRVSEWKYWDGSGGARYSYNSKGLWENTYSRTSGDITNKKYYDFRNRISKEENFKDGVKNYVYEYSYSKEGDDLLKVVKTTTNLSDGKKTTLTDYYKDGVNLYSGKNYVLTYDSKGNWYQKVNNGKVFSQKEITYHDGSSSGVSNSSNTTPPAPNTPNIPNSTPNTPINSNDCVSGDCQNGWGKKNYEYGYYEGFWENGKREGYGFFRWTKSGDYIGFWSNDKLHGYGCYLGKEKNMIGEYSYGNMNGAGYTHELANDKWVYAIFKNYLVETEYTFYDNKIDTGCIAGDCQNKYGRYKWSNGDTFTGFFKNGKMFMGTYSFASGDKYEGMFNSNNQFHGGGRFFFKDNSYYGGNWVNGLQQGRGYFISNDKITKIGEWNNGNLVKPY